MSTQICVVVPVFNRAHLVLATLDSVTAQTIAPERLVVVDDGSTDDCQQQVSRWLRERARDFKGILVRKTHGGVSSARNSGLAAAGQCSLVAFLDSDDIWPSDFLARTSAALATCTAAVAATVDREIRTDRGVAVQDLSRLATAPIEWMMTHGAGIASASLFRTRAIRGRGGFDARHLTGEDSALFLPLSLDGPWLHVPGRPTVFDRRVVGRGAAEPNLSNKFPDNFRRWARLHEDFIMREGGDRAVAPAIYRRLLGKIWYRAGRELARGGYLLDARECFAKSLQWNPRHYKSWQHRTLVDICRLWRNRKPRRRSPARSLDTTSYPAEARVA